MVSSKFPGRAPVLLLSSFIMIASGCSKPGDERQSAAETGISAETAGSSTPAPSPDSTVTPAPADTPSKSPAQTGSVAAPPTPKPRIKPSIDPGRKQTTPPQPAPSAPAGMKETTAAAAPAAAAGSQGQYLKYDASSNTVTFELIAGPSGFQFNGYSSGGATLSLPPKANVVMNFVNKDGTPHSAEIISGEGPLPNSAVDAAIPRAYTNQLLQGLPQEGTDVMRFTVPESGTYRIFCGVPGHGLSGMWIWMKVDPAAKTPSFGPTKA
jgi:Sulfocyanin (SoxE) domain